MCLLEGTPVVSSPIWDFFIPFDMPVDSSEGHELLGETGKFEFSAFGVLYLQLTI